MIVEYTNSDLVNVLSIFVVRDAFRISLKVAQSFGHILFETALACSHGQLLFELGRLRPHPSLRDYGL
jgi:hypothetical protein